MKKVVFLISVLSLAIFFLLAEKSFAATPSWVVSRPISRDYYIEICTYNKKENREDCQKIAEDKALYNLSSEISVDISGTFVQKIVERTGLSEQDVRMEIRTSSRTRLSGHELAGQWEDRKNHWAYFKLSKQQYNHQRKLEKERAIAAAVDMLTRAGAAKAAGDMVSALRFYFEALARVEDFIGENIQTTFQNRSVFLFNEIYANIQLVMAGIRLKSEKSRVHALIGEPLDEALTIEAILKNEAGEETNIAGLPVRFDLPGKESKMNRLSVTNDHGLAGVTLANVRAADNGGTIRGYVNVDALCPAKDTRGFFRALIDKLTIPEIKVIVNTFEDRDAFYWHREFEEKNVLILSAYQTKESSAKWMKIRDELLNFIKSKGARIKRLPMDVDLQRTIHLSQDAGVEWVVNTMPDIDFIFVMTAVGRLNERENAKNPFGEDVQFAGEIRTSVYASGELYFSDQYKGTTGWNPMGEEMCMDVLALHVFKRWKTKYLKHLNS